MKFNDQDWCMPCVCEACNSYHSLVQVQTTTLNGKELLIWQGEQRMPSELMEWLEHQKTLDPACTFMLNGTWEAFIAVGSFTGTRMCDPHLLEAYRMRRASRPDNPRYRT